MDETSLTLRRNTRFAAPLALTGADGQPVNLTDIALTFIARARDGDADLQTKALVIGSPPTAGVATLTLTPDEVSALDPGTYRYEVRAGDGTVPVAGPLFVLPEWG